MKKNISPDKQRARALNRMAEITLERLEETNKLKYPSNTLKDYYNAIHQLMEALLYLEGTKISGEGSHFDLINYVARKFNLLESERIFLQEVRDFRNKFSYEGLSIKEDYIKRNQEKFLRIINKLRKEIKNLDK